MTLIELLVAISLWAVILPIVGGTIYVLLRAQAAAGDSLADALTLSRFSETFRRDVHAAQSAKISSRPARPAQEIARGKDLGPVEEIVLKFETPRSVLYSVASDGTLLRRVNNGSSVERREEFRLVGSQTRFELSADGRGLAALHWPRNRATAGPAQTAEAPPIRIEALIGRDRRFAEKSQGPTGKSSPARKSS